MKVGILTLHNTTNYGATLQAYALWHYLNGLGINVEVIDYRPRKVIEAYRRHLFELKRRKPILRNAILWTKMKWFVNKHLKLSLRTVYDQELMKQFIDDYDVVICGSDEIWNIYSPIIGFDSAFFLDFIDKTKTKKSSYAASFGFTSSLKQDDIQSISKFLPEFSYISVRDSNSKKIVSEIYDGPISKVLDPTFLIQEHYHSLIKPINLTRRYILIYSNGLNNHHSKIISYLAKKLDLYVISVGVSRFKIANKTIIDADPIEWLNLFKNADFIFTEFYHGTIFSIIFKKQFWVLPHKDKQTKINDLLIDLKLEKRILNIENLVPQESAEELESLLEQVNYSLVFPNLNQRLEQSTQFLSNVLQ
jgi:polysaccharide pyruvyl transferase WcaK-like protein